jgi:hypothetical protein
MEMVGSPPRPRAEGAIRTKGAIRSAVDNGRRSTHHHAASSTPVAASRPTPAPSGLT